MTPIQQLMLGVGASKKTYVDDVFSTFLYDGTGSAQSINNGINLSGEGGLTWIKSRTSGYSHALYDTVRGNTKHLYSNHSWSEQTFTTGITSFNNNGFSLGTHGDLNNSSQDFSSWTFRKAKGFFDVVTYTGNGNSRTIAHSLSSIPGCILIKCTSQSQDWVVYHRNSNASPEDYVLRLNDSNAAFSAAAFNNTLPSSTHFSLGTAGSINGNGETYVAYVFAGGESNASEARSVVFDGAEDSLLIESNSDLAFGTGDFTIEFWVKPQTLGYVLLFDMRPNPAATQGAYPVIYYENNSLKYFNNGDKITGNKLSLDQWQHIALSRSGTSTKMFLNGIQQGSTYSDSTNYLNGDTTIGLRSDGSTGDLDGYISNVRCVKGTAVYTSSFRPPTQPLANITNTKLLCCNKPSAAGSTVTPSTITATGATASTDSPFDDPAGFNFGDSKEGIIKCDSYKGNGANPGVDVNIGFEPQFIMIKRTDTAANWAMVDSMRGISYRGADKFLFPNLVNADQTSTYISLTSTGFQLHDGNFLNQSGASYVYLAIRRPDGYVGKPVELGSSVFAMDIGNGSSTIPAFDSGFPVDMRISKAFAASTDWWLIDRLRGQKHLFTQKNDAEVNTSWGQLDSNVGEGNSWDSSYQAWMWKRHAGFDLVAYTGDGAADHSIPHGLSKTPEMIWTKNRDGAFSWAVFHKDLNSGSNPQEYKLALDGSGAESNAGARWNATAPTSSHFFVGGNAETNGGSQKMIAMLFASTDVSAVGSYTGTGSSNSQTITLGFQPRFVLFKRVNASEDWFMFDSVRGMGSGNDPYLRPNKTNDQGNGYNIIEAISTGFTLQANMSGPELNNNNDRFIYYAHA